MYKKTRCYYMMRSFSVPPFVLTAQLASHTAPDAVLKGAIDLSLLSVSLRWL